MPNSQFERHAARYLKQGQALPIDINKKWSAQELSAYLNQSGLTQVAAHQKEEDQALLAQDKAQTEKLNQLLGRSKAEAGSQDPQAHIQSVGRFGFKNDKDFQAFVNSPAGKGVKAVIGTAIKAKQELKAQNDFKQLQLARRKALIKKLFFGMMAEAYLAKKAQANMANQAVERELKEMREERAEGAQDQLDGYEEQLQKIQDKTNALLQQQMGLQAQSQQLTQKAQILQNTIPVIQQRTQRLQQLNAQIQRGLSLNQTLHTATDAILKQPNIEQAKGQITSIDDAISHLRDELAGLGKTQFHDETGELLELASEDLDKVKEQEIIIETRIKDLEEDKTILDYEVKKVENKTELADLRAQFIMVGADGEEIPVLPELPPHMQKERREKLANLVGLFTDEEQDHIHQHQVHPRTLLSRWLNDAFRLYDEEGNSITSKEKRDKGAFLLPKHKHLIKYNGVKYIVPAHIETTEDLLSMSIDDLAKAQFEAEQDRYRTAGKACESSIQRSQKEEEDTRMRIEGLLERINELEDKILKVENEARALEGELATVRDNVAQQLSGQQDPNTAPRPSPSKGSSQGPSKAPTLTPRIRAAFQAMELDLTRQTVTEYVHAVGREALEDTHPNEYEALKRIITSGNPEEKRQIFQNLERINGGITASYREQFQSPYSTVTFSGDMELENTQDRRYRTGKSEEDRQENRLSSIPNLSRGPRPPGSG